MREQRRASKGMGILVLATVLAVGAPAFAAPGSADLVVEGPLDLDGRSALAAAGGFLLLRDGANEDAYDAVTLNLQAPFADVVVHRIRDGCAGPTFSRAQVAQMELPAGLSGLTRLDAAVDAAVNDLLLSTQGALALPVAAPSVPTAQSLTASLGAALEPHTVGAGAPSAIPGVPGPVGDVCLNRAVIDEKTELRISSFTVLATALASDYVLLWQADAAEPGDAPRLGHATLQAPSGQLGYRQHGESIRLLGDGDPYGEHDAVARLHIPEDILRVAAPSGDGGITGDGVLWVYGALATLGGDEESGQRVDDYETGETPDGSGRRVVTFLEIRLTNAAGGFTSPGSVALAGHQVTGTTDGTLRIPSATGDVRQGDETFTFDGSEALLGGQLSYQLRPKDADARHGHEGAKAGAMLLALSGDVQQVQGAGALDESPDAVTGTIAMVSLAAIGAGAIAWAWPGLKYVLAPLYTRIPTDALLHHDAREKIYKLIREEAGIHAHEVAARLDLGWGTAVYHLKLLEKNGLVVARHEGRYKRFFVTGDQRLQRQDAVGLLRNPTSRSIAAQVAQQPGLIQKQVCQALSLSPSLASWHLQRLEAADLVRGERLGRAVRYIPGAAWTDLQRMDGPTGRVMPPAEPVPVAAAPSTA